MPEQPSYTLRNFTVICNVVLFGTYLVIIAISILLVISFGLDYNIQTLGSLAVCVIALIYALFIQWLLHKGRHHIVAHLLILFYSILAAGIVWSWGINTPIGTLILALVIVLAGILLTARHALFAALASGLLLIAVQTAIMMNWHTPDTSWASNASCFGDVLAYGVVFSMLALVSWLYNREMESSLAHARHARAALLQQKATLKMQVKMRTAELRRAQLEEMQQMYRFAELGQLGVTLLHDLANHLTALTLEMEDLQRTQHSKAISRARRIIKYLEEIVDSTRERLHGNAQKQTFNIVRKTDETIAFLGDKATKAHVTIEWQSPIQSLMYTGDAASLSQVIAIITNNAIDAYGPTANKSLAKKRRVVVTMQRDDTFITIQISDWGKGIAKNERKHLFKPFQTTKKSGMGLGLYIAKQTIEMQFSGTIEINPDSDHTEFIIKLPITNAR